MAKNPNPCGIRDVQKKSRSRSVAWLAFDVFSILFIGVAGILVFVHEIIEIQFEDSVGHDRFCLSLGVLAILIYPVMAGFVTLLEMKSLKIRSVLLMLPVLGLAVLLIKMSWYNALGMAV